jgi:hypothetical protein
LRRIELWWCSRPSLAFSGADPGAERGRGIDQDGPDLGEATGAVIR